MVFREEVINVSLAEALKEFGLDALPETIQHKGTTKKLPDVFIYIQGVRVILEGRRYSNYQSLKNDAIDRIKDGLSEVCIALQYEDILRNSSDLSELKKNIRKGRFSGDICIFDQGRINCSEFSAIKIDDLVHLINNMVHSIVSSNTLNEIVSKAEQKFDELSIRLSKNTPFKNNIALADNLKSILSINYEINSNKDRKDLIDIALFILFDAMVFQEGISAANTKVNNITNIKKPYKKFFIDEWDKILKIDYKAIFYLASNLLKSLPSNDIVEDVLKELTNLSSEVLSSGILRKHDFMGRIYHKLLLKTTGAYYATYYTAVPSAYILTRLISNEINDEIFRENSLNDLAKFRIIDPASGSGTLLSAAYMAIKEKYIDRYGYIDWDKFHKIMIEKVIYGWDVLDYAAHLTLTVLALHNPTVLVNGSNILTMPNGREMYGGQEYISLGSLEFLGDNLDNFIGKDLQRPASAHGVESNAERYIKLETQNLSNSFDIVIMNPPFSRSAGKVNTKFGYSDSNLKEKMNEKYSLILQQNGIIGVGQAGMGAPFIFVGDKLLKEGGLIGIVIPRGILSGVSWSLVRQKLMRSYNIKYIISNYDPGGKGRDIEPWNWSEDTHIGEVMLIAKKMNNENKNNETIMVNFWKKPENEYKAILSSLQIKPNKLKGYVEDGIYEEFYDGKEAVGSYYKIQQNTLGDNWLAPVLFANPNLNSVVLILDRYLMNSGKYIKDVVSIKTTKAKNKNITQKIYLAGMDRRQVEDYFKKDNVETQYKYIEGVSGINGLYPISSVTNASLKKREGKDAFNLYSSNLLLAERIWTNSSKLISIYTESTKVIATEYWEIILDNKYSKYDKAISLWFNSTFGFMHYLSNCINNMGVAFNMKKHNLLMVKIPEFIFNIDVNKIELLYDTIKSKNFDNFGKQFLDASNKEGVRFEIDNFFLGQYPKDLRKNMESLYKMLIKEPIFM